MLPNKFEKWFLTVNTEKTEYISLRRSERRIDESWRRHKKLGTLLGDTEDVTRRKILSNGAFRKLMSLWGTKKKLTGKTKIRIYNSFLLPILTYNCGTWGLTKLENQKLDSFHRSQLRAALNIRYPQKITNDNLYKLCNSEILSIEILKSRWRLFGHILRMDVATPANIAMETYFMQCGDAFRGRPRTTPPSVLNQDLKTIGRILETADDLDNLRELAKRRGTWRRLWDSIVVHAAQGKLN
ncbi:uncharacterized protein LOC115231616 [Octopus sinensis]|uniref:Uncharacterized protein LOC115231616 n=1 Tax=Octopus sinensis TaxID=2607531 RepID=A0A6P7U573_9MOLL|nr:uncharacterized protein LOC115231616 [Octopus sinensis]